MAESRSERRKRALVPVAPTELERCVGSGSINIALLEERRSRSRKEKAQPRTAVPHEPRHGDGFAEW
jgi:hypothetical protein